MQFDEKEQLEDNVKSAPHLKTTTIPSSNSAPKAFVNGFTGIFNVQAKSKQLTHSNSMYAFNTKRYDAKNVQKIVLDWCVDQCKNYSVSICLLLVKF